VPVPTPCVRRLQRRSGYCSEGSSSVHAHAFSLSSRWSITAIVGRSVGLTCHREWGEESNAPCLQINIRHLHAMFSTEYAGQREIQHMTFSRRPMVTGLSMKMSRIACRSVPEHATELRREQPPATAQGEIVT